MFASLVTYVIVKHLHGVLEGIEVTEQVTVDEDMPAPFSAGQRVDGIGGAYTVVSVGREE